MPVLRSHRSNIQATKTHDAVRIVAATEIIFGVDDGVLEAFHMTTAPLIDLIEANKQESRTLAITRDLLLPKLMAGEIQLLDAEKPLEAVA